MARSRSNAGFTLIELLVVIVVIVLLLLIMVPWRRTPPVPRYITVCATNLDQTHIALHTTLLDRENHQLPTTPWGETVVGPRPGREGYRGDQFGFDAKDLDEYGWTYKAGLCPGVTPDTGGDTRRDFWYTRKDDGGAHNHNGSDYLYTGGRGDHVGDAPDDPEAVKAALGYPRFGFPYGKPGGIYYSVDAIYSGETWTDADGNVIRDEGYPSEVTFLSDISYNAAESYPGWYYEPYVDPSNHPDDSVMDRKNGVDLWPAVGRGSNRMKADGSIEWWEFPRRNRGKGAEMPGSYFRDYYANYY